MLSYQWSSSQQKVLKVKKGLEQRGLKVWMDVEEMRGNINQRMAEAVDKSLVICPFLNGDYQRSYNCSKELNYADLRKKKLVPCLNLMPNDKPIGWAFAITAQLMYADVSKLSPDTPEFDAQIDVLFHEITTNISEINRPIHLNQSSSNSDARSFNGLGFNQSTLQPTLTSTPDHTLRELEPGLLITSILGSKVQLQKSSVERLVATLLHSLTKALPQFRSFLEQHMEADQANITQGKRSILSDPRQAFKVLLIDGLKSLPAPHPNLVFVIDALDECGAQGDAQRNALLELLGADCKDLPVWVKIFTTARPERDVWETLHGIHTQILRPSDDLNLKDIQVFLRHHLKQWAMGSAASSREESGLEKCALRLAQKSDGVFIYARMAVSELLERDQATFDSWEKIFDAIEEYQGGLDDVYGRVLGAALNNSPVVVKEVLGAILCAKVPLTQEGLAVFLQLKESQVGVALMHIRSMLNIENGLISVLHKSLKDYATSVQRCKDPRNFIDIALMQSVFAKRGLNLLNDSLKQGISEASSDALQEYSPSSRNIPAPLQYACQFGLLHWCESHDWQVLFPEFHQFSVQHLLHWIECMLAMNSYDKIARICEKVVSHLNRNALGEEQHITLNLFKDVIRLVSRFRVPILQNPIRLYKEVIPLCPTETQIMKVYGSVAKLGVNRCANVIFGSDTKWGPLLASMDAHGPAISVVSLAFSPDGKKLVSAGHDGSTKIWDTETLQLKSVGVLQSHAIECLAFSLSGRYLATAHKWKVEVVDQITGKEVLGEEIHEMKIISVCFNKCGTIVASGSADWKIGLFAMPDSAGGVGCKPLLVGGHRGQVRSVQFSPTQDSLLVSASDDKSVRLWNAQVKPGTCEISCDLLHVIQDHSYGVTSLAFRLCGTILASGGVDNAVFTYFISEDSSRTPTQLASWTKNYEPISKVVFSKDGESLAQAAGDGFMKIHRVIYSGENTTFEFTGTLKSHCREINSLDFAYHDSTILVSGGSDGSLSFWNSHSADMAPFAYRVTSVCIGAGSLLFASRENGIIEIYDGKTLVQTLVDAHEGYISVLGASPDGKLVVSGGGDKLAQVWSIAETKEVVLKHTLKGHLNPLLRCWFSADGKTLYSRDGNSRNFGGETRKWDVGSLTEGIYEGGEVVDAKDVRGDTWHSQDWSSLKKNLGWLTVGDQRLIWLPSELRGVYYWLDGKLAVGTADGRVGMIAV
ncbi:WD40-repeat-containing domain protein [Obelidium mucronatum]|nr:WD40-repeat-containing domain protein [Obelidium mucronatum]